MKKPNFLLSILFVSLLLIIQSCGGSSNEADNHPPSAQLNSGLKGHFLWSSIDGENRRLDISTGRWHEIPVMQNWIDQNEGMRNIYGRNDSLTRFTNDGKFVLKVINDCDWDVMAQCFVVFDLDSEIVVNEFKISPISGYFMYSIALSDDGQYIAILDDNDSSSNQYRLRIYDIDGNEIDESFYSNRLVDEFVQVESVEWLSDGRLIFSYGPVIMRSTEPFSTSAKALKIFPESEGEPVDLRVSPDGTKIAYALIAAGIAIETQATPWIMDVDGSNAYPLVEASAQPELKTPVWSQDSQWIAFELVGVLPRSLSENEAFQSLS